MSSHDQNQNPKEVIEYLWYSGQLSYKLWPQQMPIYQGIRALPIHIITAVMLCARQFGKSHLGVLMAVEDCLRLQNKCILIAGPTVRQTREIVVPRLELIARDAPRGLLSRHRSLDKWYIGSCELVIGGFDTNGASQRGKTLEKVYIEEVVDSDSDQYRDSLRSDIGPAMAHAREPKIIVITTPPKIPDHSFVTETMVEASLNGCLYTYTIDENIALDADAKERCFAMTGGRDSPESRREWFCEIIRDENKVILPQFEEEVHVREISFDGDPLWQITGDVGGVRDMTVFHLHRFNYRWGGIEFAREFWAPPNTATKVLADGIKGLLALGRVESIALDAPGQVLIDLYADHGLKVGAVSKGSFEGQISLANNEFFHGLIAIDPSCKLTIETCRSGMLNKQKNDYLRSVKLGHCDAVASLIYALKMQDRTLPKATTRNEFFFSPPPPTNIGKAVKHFGTFK